MANGADTAKKAAPAAKKTAAKATAPPPPATTAAAAAATPAAATATAAATAPAAAASSGGPTPFDVVIDARSLPSEFDKPAYVARIKELFESRDIDLGAVSAKAHAAYVAGALLRDGYYTATSPGFETAFSDELNEGYLRPETIGHQKLPGVAKDVDEIRRIEVYQSVTRLLEDFKGRQAPTAQEVAAVSDDVLERGPVNDNTRAKARSAFDDFVGQAPAYDTLDLPPLVTDESSQGVYETENIRATAMIGAANHLDRAGLMTAVDQAAQDWSVAEVPVGRTAGLLFDPYVWDARDRLDPAARQIQYDRVRELDEYLLRFCSAVSERERGLYLSEYLVGSQRDRRSPQPQDAAVRKTARDLLGYASLHGWAYTAFAARRIGNHIRLCVEIIQNVEVQKAYGVDGPWPLVERIITMSTGQTPNIAKELTLSSTGKDIIDRLADKAKDIAINSTSVPLFPLRTDPVAGQSVGFSSTPAVFSDSEYLALLNLVENWLAANAITDTQRFDAAQPRDSAPTSSLPNPGGFAGPDSNAIRDQLMQMVGAGQMPSVDQVNQLFGR